MSSLYWLVTGKTVGGLTLYPPRNRLDRETALRIWTENVAWFLNEVGRKGRIANGQLADLAVLDRDYFNRPEDDIQDIVSSLTVVGGKIVHGDASFSRLSPALPAPMPDWSPAGTFGGYHGRSQHAVNHNVGLARSSCSCASACNIHGHSHDRAWMQAAPTNDLRAFWGALGCSCWAF
jgi:hypothetical protein